MKKHITDAKTGINYTLHGEYYLPDISLPAEEEIPIGMWGQRHSAFLKNHQRGKRKNFETKEREIPSEIYAKLCEIYAK